MRDQRLPNRPPSEKTPETFTILTSSRLSLENSYLHQAWLYVMCEGPLITVAPSQLLIYTSLKCPTRTVSPTKVFPVSCEPITLVNIGQQSATCVRSGGDRLSPRHIAMLSRKGTRDPNICCMENNLSGERVVPPTVTARHCWQELGEGHMTTVTPVIPFLLSIQAPNIGSGATCLETGPSRIS